MTRHRFTRRHLMRTAPASIAGLSLLASRDRQAGAAPEAIIARQDETPVRGGTLTYGASGPGENVINPLNTQGSGQNRLIEALFLRLVYGREWGDGMNPQESGPIDLAVAETMTEIETDRVWEFTIRDNVKWHDGMPVTADDVIFGIWLSLNKDAKVINETPVVGIKGRQRLQEEGGGSLTPSYNIEVEGATKLGDNAVRIELEQPTANYWVDWNVGYWPMPTHIFGDVPLANLFDEPYATMPVGNGPFKAVRYVEGQYMEMEANEDFYLGRPYVDKYIVRFGDADTMAAALEAQEIDGSNVTPGPVFDRLTSLAYIVGNPVRTDLPEGIEVNVEQVPEGAALNRAIMHAIDVATLNQQLYSDTLSPSNYLFEHIAGFEQPPAGFQQYDYNPEKAQEILAEIGWDSSRELRWILWYAPGPAEDAIQAMLADVGIQTQYKQIDIAAVTDQIYNGTEWDISFSNFSGDQNMEAVWKFIKCGWNYEAGGWNATRYCNPEVDELWEQGLAETDAATRKEIFDEISLLLNQDPPQATFWRSSVGYVWNSRVRGAYPYQYRLPVRPAFERVWLAS